MGKGLSLKELEGEKVCFIISLFITKVAGELNPDSKTGGQQRILVDLCGRRRGDLSLKRTLVDLCGRQKMRTAEGGLDTPCSLVFALAPPVLEMALFCP